MKNIKRDLPTGTRNCWTLLKHGTISSPYICQGHFIRVGLFCPLPGILVKCLFWGHLHLKATQLKEKLCLTFLDPKTTLNTICIHPISQKWNGVHSLKDKVLWIKENYFFFHSPAHAVSITFRHYTQLQQTFSKHDWLCNMTFSTKDFNKGTRWATGRKIGWHSL